MKGVKFWREIPITRWVDAEPLVFRFPMAPGVQGATVQIERECVLSARGGSGLIAVGDVDDVALRSLVLGNMTLLEGADVPLGPFLSAWNDGAFPAIVCKGGLPLRVEVEALPLYTGGPLELSFFPTIAEPAGVARIPGDGE